MRYQDLGPDYYERRAQVSRQIAHHVGKLGALGFEVTLCRIPNPNQTEQATPQPPDPYRPARLRLSQQPPGSAAARPPELLFSGQQA
jgi:hypothetical protein